MANRRRFIACRIYVMLSRIPLINIKKADRSLFFRAETNHELQSSGSPFDQ